MLHCDIGRIYTKGRPGVRASGPIGGIGAHDDAVQVEGRGQSADDARGIGLPGRSAGPLQPARTGADPGGARARRGRSRPRRRAARLDRAPHRPQPERQVRRPRALGRAACVVGEQRPDGAGALRGAVRRHARPCRRGRAVRPGPLRRGRPRIPAERPGGHRARLARALHPPPAAPPGARRARGLHAGLHHPELPELQGRPGPTRLPFRDRGRDLLRAEARADRGHRLCGREQEVGLHHPQLPAARPGRDADALLGQPCRGRFGRRRGVLRPVRHRQDHAVGRSRARADR